MRRPLDRPSGFLTLQEAAERLGLHPESLLRSIRRARRDRKKPIVKPYERPAWRAARKFWFNEYEVAAAARERQTLRS